MTQLEGKIAIVTGASSGIGAATAAAFAGAGASVVLTGRNEDAITAITRGDATETSDDEWRQIMAVNVDAVFFLSRAAVRAMRNNPGQTQGTIVNLASNVGLVGSAALPAYCASKGAVVLLTKSMALDHAAEGIRVNALCPGAVDTPMLISKHEKTGRTPDDVFAANIASIPEGRVPKPDEIAKSMLFLASDASSHITGVALPIDGGYTAQ